MDTPVIVNNTQNSVVDTLSGKIDRSCEVSIATDKLSLYASEALKLDRAKSLRLLLTQPEFSTSLCNEPSELSRSKRLIQSILARDFAEFIANKASVRGFEQPNSGAKVLTLKDQTGVSTLLPGPDLTLDGIGVQASTQFYQGMFMTGMQAEAMGAGFEAVWNAPNVVDLKQTLLTRLDEIAKDRSPAELYQKTISEIFKNQSITESMNTQTGIKESQIYRALYEFQRDAMYGIIDKIEKYNGCILADSVGLGKTFTALAVIRYYELRNSRVLVLAPKKLRSNWTQYKSNEITNPFANDRFNYDVLNHTDLTRENGYSDNINLAMLNYENYDLLVIDESHNFRTDSSASESMTRYNKILRDICQKGVHTRVLLLSATPVNNRIKDLTSQLKFITTGDDAAFESIGIESLDNLTRVAQSKFNKWSKLPIEERTVDRFMTDMEPDYFKLLDTITIARSRKHIEANYNIPDLGKFPTRNRPINIVPETLNTERRVLIKTINDLVADQLTLAIFAPLNALKVEAEPKYRKQLEEIKGTAFSDRGREGTTMKLILSMVLKRLESSVDSFRETIQTFREKTQKTLNRINKIDVIERYTAGFDLDDPDYADLVEGFDDNDLDEFIQGRKNKVHVDPLDIDPLKWRPALEADLNVFDQILAIVEDCRPENDEKLRRLYEDCLAPKWGGTVRQVPCTPCTPEEIDFITGPVNEPDANGNYNRKVIIFTAYTDTARYLYNALAPRILKEYGLRSALVTGTRVESNLEISPAIAKKLPTNRFDSVLTHFSPKSKNRHAIITKLETSETCPEIDVLFATDCISEGQNLQDCDYLINYDIHWNPVRIIQRFGRIDRIGSTNDKIQLVSFWPTRDLDEYLKLSQRVKSRNVLANITGGGGSAPTDETGDDVSTELDYRKRQLERLRKEVVDLEEIRGGISITDMTFQDYRADLMRIQGSQAEKLAAIPFGSCAVCACSNAQPHAGAFFLLKARNADKASDDQNPLYPFYPVLVAENGTILDSHKNNKRLLALIRQTCSSQASVDPSHLGSFAIASRTEADMAPYAALLQKAIDHVDGVASETGQGSLFRKGGTSLKSSQSTDYEVVCFIIFKEAA